MSIFAVISEDDTPVETVDAQVRSKFPDAHFRFGTRTWFVAAEGKTTRRVSDEIGIAGAWARGRAPDRASPDNAPDLRAAGA